MRGPDAEIPALSGKRCGVGCRAYHGLLKAQDAYAGDGEHDGAALYSQAASVGGTMTIVDASVIDAAGHVTLTLNAARR